MDQQNFKYNRGVVSIPVFIIILMWLVYFIEIKFGYNFNKYGVYPRSLVGLRGILFSPFIHGDAKHLFNNSVPLLVMMGSLFFFYKKIAFKILIYGGILTGLITWVIARPSYHIGASGIVYLLVSFVFFSGIIRKYYRLTALSFVVVFLYGSIIWYIFPTEERISWEGHLAGFITGILFAVIYRKMGPQQKKFEYTKNEEFESYFDEDGNFNPPEEEPESIEEI
ncbi:rhomboid family intramembrane serine protease [Lutibacter citreus]|uniref:rhomboid family intramembrane serine protease n=1 Tax=Lutibacter citreus TaxID=2138210 RepID=UPI000DBE8E7F|nr:rhomboid family intramembrane serine protease [Lutibacter citreus]